jgi:hypothetical protein
VLAASEGSENVLRGLHGLRGSRQDLRSKGWLSGTVLGNVAVSSGVESSAKWDGVGVSSRGELRMC